MMTMTLPQINGNLINALNQNLNNIFAPGGGITHLINSLFGQNNLVPASPV